LQVFCGERAINKQHDKTTKWYDQLLNGIESSFSGQEKNQTLFFICLQELSEFSAFLSSCAGAGA
jgi:hypothetical protein